MEMTWTSREGWCWVWSSIMVAEITQLGLESVVDDSKGREASELFKSGLLQSSSHRAFRRALYVVEIFVARHTSSCSGRRWGRNLGGRSTSVGVLRRSESRRLSFLLCFAERGLDHPQRRSISLVYSSSIRRTSVDYSSNSISDASPLFLPHRPFSRPLPRSTF